MERKKEIKKERKKEEKIIQEKRKWKTRTTEAGWIQCFKTFSFLHMKQALLISILYKVPGFKPMTS